MQLGTYGSEIQNSDLNRKKCQNKMVKDAFSVFPSGKSKHH